MAKPYASIMVPEDKRNAFYEAYTETIQAGNCITADRNQGLAGPLVVDLDFRFPGDVEDR